MANLFKKPGASSNFPIQQPSNIHRDPAKLSAAEIEEALAEAFEAEDYPRVLELLDAAPRWMKKQPEFMLIHATALISLGDDQESLRLLREIERKNPRFTAAYLPLAMLDMDRGWPAHALKAAKRALSDRDLPDESRVSLEELVEEATGLIQQQAAALGLSFENMQRAGISNEQAEMAMDENRLSEADHFFREAVKIAPNWNPPHNNRAQALYFSGRTTEAIAVSEAVLARDAENAFALSSLVTFYIGLDQPEKARDYADRLEKLSKKFPAPSMDIEQAISALSFVEDTAALWKIAKRFLEAPSDSLFGRSWHCLAVAAIRSGKWKDAQKLIGKANDEELSPAGEKLRDELNTVAGQHQPHLAWMPPAYPGVDLLLHPKVMAEWEALLQTFSRPFVAFSEAQVRRFFSEISIHGCC